MQAIRYVPGRALAPYINACWEIRHELSANETLAIPFGCTGRAHVVINLQTPFNSYRQSGQPMSVADATLFCQVSRPYTTHLGGPTLGLVIQFTPTGLHTLWSLPVGELSDQSHDLTAVASVGIRDLIDQLREARSTARRFALVDAFLLRRLTAVGGKKGSSVRTDGRIEAAVDHIRQYPGHVDLTKLAHSLNSSERSFRRRFTDVVGVSPKHYVRMQRFMHTRRWLDRQSKPNWQDLLALMGYYDQAHLINEFGHFAGKSPLLYGSAGAGAHDFLFA